MLTVHDVQKSLPWIWVGGLHLLYTSRDFIDLCHSPLSYLLSSLRHLVWLNSSLADSHLYHCCQWYHHTMHQYISYFSPNYWSHLLIFVFTIVRHWADIFIEVFTITLKFCFWVVLASWELHIHFIKLELSFFSLYYFTFVFIEFHLVFYCTVLWSTASTLLNQSSFLLLWVI